MELDTRYRSVGLPKSTMHIHNTQTQAKMVIYKVVMSFLLHITRRFSLLYSWGKLGPVGLFLTHISKTCMSAQDHPSVEIKAHCDST